jgi:hypothetical protein
LINVTAHNGFFFDFDNHERMGVGEPTLGGASVQPTYAKVYTTTGGVFELYGTGFYFNPIAEVVAGIVNRITYTEGGVLKAEVTGTAIDAASVFAIAQQDGGGWQLVQMVTSGADTWNLSYSDDIIGYSGSADTIDGGGGRDIVTFHGEQKDFQVSVGNGGRILVTNSSGVTDVLTNVEVLRFFDAAIDTISLSGTFVGGGGGEIVGGAGVDIATYDLERSFYSISQSADTIVITGPGGAQDNLSSIERMQFSDGVLAFDVEGVAGQAYRLYQAAFDRAPDTDGLGYWIRELDGQKGDLAWMANNFILSDEFRSTYGSPDTVSNQDFLTLVYNNVLNRGPDAEGFIYWMDELSNGFARERVLASFSESLENKANVAAAIEDGIWFV